MMSDPPRDILEIAGLDCSETADRSGPASQRPWVGIKFDCCGAYARVYRNRDATAYVGRCPRCRREVRLRIGPDGTNQRFFRAE
jgi:hypothetical protein